MKQNKVLNKLNEHGIITNAQKYVFGVFELDFLGVRISSKGIKPLTSKVEAVHKFQLPKTSKELQRFLGLVNYYLSKTPKTAPSNNCLKGCTRRNVQIEPNDEAVAPFEQCKHDLASAALLTFPDPKCAISLYTDALDTAIGSLLQQLLGGAQQPITFFSIKRNLAEKKYSAYDRELLAVYRSIIHFQYLLADSQFLPVTNH